MQYREYNDYELLYMVQECDENAYNILYEKYKPLVISFAKKYAVIYLNCGLDINDFILEGYIGLDQAIKKFKEYNDFQFQGFINTCINRQMQNLVRNTKLKRNLILNNSMYYEALDKNSEISFLEVKADEKSINPENLMLEKEEIGEFYKKYSKQLKGLELDVFSLKSKNYSNTEISKILDKNIRAINNAVTRIKKKYNKQIN